MTSSIWTLLLSRLLNLILHWYHKINSDLYFVWEEHFPLDPQINNNSGDCSELCTLRIFKYYKSHQIMYCDIYYDLSKQHYLSTFLHDHDIQRSNFAMFEQFLIITPLLWATNTWHKPGHPGAVVHWHHDHHYHHLVSVLCWELGLRDNHRMIQFYCNRETTTAGRTGDADKKLILVFWQHEVAVEGGIDMNHAMITQQPMAHGKIQLMLAVLARR